jgi:uncharacterized RDD family membrane protein YckC
MDAPLRRGFWIRCAAAIIDLVCAIIIGVALPIAIDAMGLTLSPDGWERLETIAWCAAVMLVGSFDIWTAASPGKAILRLAVGRHDGTPAPASARVLRWAIMYGPFVLHIANQLSSNGVVYWMAGLWLAGVLIGCLAASNDDKQAWHDQLAGTAVFRWRDVYPRSIARGFDAIPPPLPPGAS